MFPPLRIARAFSNVGGGGPHWRLRVHSRTFCTSGLIAEPRVARAFFLFGGEENDHAGLVPSLTSKIPRFRGKNSTAALSSKQEELARASSDRALLFQQSRRSRTRALIAGSSLTRKVSCLSQKGPQPKRRPRTIARRCGMKPGMFRMPGRHKQRHPAHRMQFYHLE